MTYNTRNPLGSNDPRDLFDNAQNFDKALNELVMYWIDRLGVQRLTEYGRNQLFNQLMAYFKEKGEEAITVIGWHELGDWSVGLQITNRNQIVNYNGSWYKFLGELPHTIAGDSPDNDGGVWSSSNTAGVWANIGDAALRSNLGSSEGQLLIGAPSKIDDLRYISPLTSARIQTKGAFEAYDMGHGDWVYDHSDMSEFVTQYPRLFIAPYSDPTGSSGAWKLNVGNDIPTRSYGVGLTSDPDVNSDILNQVFKYNNGKRWVVLPPFSIWLSSVEIRGTDPKVKGTPGATAGINGGNGTAIITKESFSTADVFRVTSSSDSSNNRVTGCFVKDIKIVSYDFFNTPGYDTFSTRTNRRAFSFNYCGAQLDISGLVAIGFKQGMYCNELWDGSLNNIRLMYCSDSAGAGIR